MFEGLKKLNEEMEEARSKMREKLQKQGQKELKGAFQELFDKHPKLSAIRWEQYTPYFNDGEPCEFSVHGWRIQAEGMTSRYASYAKPGEEYEGENEDKFFDEYEVEGITKSLQNDIESLFRALDDDCMEMTFGDHVQVTATKDGFDVEEYEHD